MPQGSPTTAYCTIIAANYLPQALSLFESVQRHSPSIPFHLLVIDAEANLLPALPTGIAVTGLEVLGLDHREQHNLATIYDVVELSTAVKPLFLSQLLRDYDRVVYLDPDMWIVSPLDELNELIDDHGVVLTPHILEPIRPGEILRSEVSTLVVGMHNLGFCAVGKAGAPFLDWWWSHLQRECLIYPLLGMFVDQKWTDIGATMFSAHSLKHYGYNIGHWNLHERRFVDCEGGYIMLTTGEPLRLMHFSGFDPRRPQDISVRQNVSLAGTGLDFEGYVEVSQQYAEVLLKMQSNLDVPTSYGWALDSSGRSLPRRLRRTYRMQLLTEPNELPSPFLREEQLAFSRWRRASRLAVVSNATTDAALAFKYAFPDSYEKIKHHFPNLFSRARSSLLDRSRIRR